MSQAEPWFRQYERVKRGRNWRSWPLIRTLRGARLRRLAPIDAGRGGELSVIRYYWAEFLEGRRSDFRGRALEVGETATVRYYGGDALTQADAIDLSPHSPEVAIVADLARAEHAPGEQYDCFLLQFTTNVIFDIESALFHAVRLLKPGGVLLTNFWCTDFYFHKGLDMGTGGPLYMHWFFTPVQVQNLLCRLGLAEKDFALSVYGNLLTKTAFLMNLPARELTARERDHRDPHQPLLICARIVRPPGWRQSSPPPISPTWLPTQQPMPLHPETGHFGDAYLRRDER